MVVGNSAEIVGAEDGSELLVVKLNQLHGNKRSKANSVRITSCSCATGGVDRESVRDFDFVLRRTAAHQIPSKIP